MSAYGRVRLRKLTSKGWLFEKIHQHTVSCTGREVVGLLVGAVAMSSHTGSGETAAGGGGSKRRAADADQDGGETSAGGKIPKLRFTMPTQKPQDEYDDDGVAAHGPSMTPSPGWLSKRNLLHDNLDIRPNF